MIVLLFPRRTPISSLNYSFDESLGVQVARVDRQEEGKKKKGKKKGKNKKKKKKEKKKEKVKKKKKRATD